MHALYNIYIICRNIKTNVCFLISAFNINITKNWTYINITSRQCGNSYVYLVEGLVNFYISSLSLRRFLLWSYSTCHLSLLQRNYAANSFYEHTLFYVDNTQLKMQLSLPKKRPLGVSREISPIFSDTSVSFLNATSDLSIKVLMEITLLI